LREFLRYDRGMNPDRLTTTRCHVRATVADPRVAP
jgi:hypothetical protein